ncbi:MAG: hypothetical protein MJ054_02080, partial [Clostridia bacterium]|nr:hypothetical protein [Clostridia bacterium]
TTIGLSGTTGGNNLRPLVNLNKVKVGNDYVLINRLNIITDSITTFLFMLINFIFSFTHNVPSECYKIVYITLSLYLLIWLSIYIFYPRIKSALNLKKIGLRQIILSTVLCTVTIICAVASKTPSILWLLVFAMFPIVRLVVITVLHKRNLFSC